MTIVVRTFAAEVRVSATIKAENMIDQHIPDTNTNFVGRNSSLQNRFPSINERKTDSATAMAVLRQKVTSKLPAVSRCLVTTPAVLWRRVIKTINNAAQV